MDNNIQFNLRELIRAAEMSGINPQQIPGDITLGRGRTAGLCRGAPTSMH